MLESVPMGILSLGTPSLVAMSSCEKRPRSITSGREARGGKGSAFSELTNKPAYALRKSKRGISRVRVVRFGVATDEGYDVLASIPVPTINFDGKTHGRRR